MTDTEQRAIRNVIARLKERNCGCAPSVEFDGLTAAIVKIADEIRVRDESRMRTLEIVSRIYLDTWVIPALELLLDGPDCNPRLAADLAGR